MALRKLSAAADSVLLKLATSRDPLRIYVLERELGEQLVDYSIN